ncbi:MAG: hypothetical protein WCT04_24935 [Planctomycetota bacterium]
MRKVTQIRRSAIQSPGNAAATVAPGDSLLLDALHLDGFAIHDCGVCIEITIGQFGEAPFAAKIRVPKGLSENSLRAFLLSLTEKEEDILAYVAEAVKALPQ